MHPKKQSDVGLESLEEIMEFMDEQMLQKAMSKMKKPEQEVAQTAGDSEQPEDLDTAQPVPMADENSEEDEIDEESMRALMEQYQSEMA